MASHRAADSHRHRIGFWVVWMQSNGTGRPIRCGQLTEKVNQYVGSCVQDQERMRLEEEKKTLEGEEGAHRGVSWADEGEMELGDEKSEARNGVEVRCPH